MGTDGLVATLADLAAQRLPPAGPAQRPTGVRLSAPLRAHSRLPTSFGPAT
ncbi:hypothetical protein RB614_38000 [Phytohabitans sp. ZYX-F-186]|uniref:Uncharacterized protein n=1 Tax=Phytohabitans maris TaxID=3071409 RepID=A0ABU0ZTD8_9ACTN|nr:hypothetical protein [Phytohabitans sp. ZYX-F-186]